MASVSFRNVFKRYGSVEVIHGVSLDIADGEFMVLVGPSGCGKSTLLRMLAGLEWFERGEITIGEQVVNAVHAKDRDIAMVFQSYALYPHMTVAENMAFGLELRRQPKERITASVARAARMLDLDAYLSRFPRELSGGQRQRVAMGRAIVRSPKVFLFDEPLSNLDAKLRVAMRAEIKSLQQSLHTTTVYVTHDQVEAMTMADRIAVLRDGRIEQVGTPLEIYDRPANLFVAQFIGSHGMNVVEGRYDRIGSTVACEADGNILRWCAPPGAAPDGAEVALGVRPDALELAPVHAEGAVPARVKLVQRTGSETELILEAGRHALTLVAHARLPVQAGENVVVRASADRVHLFDRASGQRLVAPSTN